MVCPSWRKNPPDNPCLRISVLPSQATCTAALHCTHARIQAPLVVSGIGSSTSIHGNRLRVRARSVNGTQRAPQLRAECGGNEASLSPARAGPG